VGVSFCVCECFWEGPIASSVEPTVTIYEVIDLKDIKVP
jgi:hypothetical protein